METRRQVWVEGAGSLESSGGGKPGAFGQRGMLLQVLSVTLYPACSDGEVREGAPLGMAGWRPLGIPGGPEEAHHLRSRSRVFPSQSGRAPVSPAEVAPRQSLEQKDKGVPTCSAPPTTGKQPPRSPDPGLHSPRGQLAAG